MTPAALIALLQPPRTEPNGHSEAWVQSQVRLEAAALGWLVFRNNSGATRDETGRLIRYGLGHESEAINAVLKSSDLIGWTGTGRFVSLEIKAPGWQLTAGDKRGIAQARWLAAVVQAGGIGRFITGTGQLDRIVKVG